MRCRGRTWISGCPVAEVGEGGRKDSHRLVLQGYRGPSPGRTRGAGDKGGDSVHSAPRHLVNLNGNFPLHWEAASDSPGVLRDSEGLPFSNPAAQEFWGGTSHSPFPVLGSD